MELIEIIKSTLSILSTTTFIFLIISYTIFRIKDRYRIKPYLSVNVQKPLVGILNNKIGKKANIISEEEFAEQNQANKIVFVKLSIQNKFKIINGNVNVGRLNKAENSLHR